METIRIEIEKLVKNPDNPRTIKDDKFKKLVQSLKDFPEMMEMRPIVVNSEMVILGCNMRFEAAKSAGWKHVPVIITDLTPEKQREFIIKDNVSGGEWDFEMLAIDWDISELTEWGLDIPSGFIKELEAKEDDYEIPDEIKTDITPGDLFQIGRHRLLCGDSTDSDAVARLMNGEKADMLFTDPPYNANYKSRGQNEDLRNGIMNDNMTDNEFEYFIKQFINTTLLNIKEGASLYICCNWKDSYPRFYTNLSNSGITISANIVWNKKSAGMGWQDYRYQYEFIIYGFKKGSKHNWYGDRTQTDVWDFSRDNRNDYKHPTQKPVDLPSRAIKNSSKEGELILELFTGSGTTMVAADQLNRKCYGVEIDPKYCQVIIDRMKKLVPDIEVKKIN